MSGEPLMGSHRVLVSTVLALGVAACQRPASTGDIIDRYRSAQCVNRASRRACGRRGTAIQQLGKPKKAASKNSESAAAQVYNRLDQTRVAAWLDLPNKAAQDQCGEYTADQVENMGHHAGICKPRNPDSDSVPCVCRLATAEETFHAWTRGRRHDE